MRPHRTDSISLSFGLLFLLIAAWWAIAQVATVRLPAAGWLVAGGLILFGAVGLLGAIRSGRRPEVPAPVQAEAQVETPGDLPPEMHADIVRELLDNPADRVDLHPAYLKHPVPDPATSTGPASAPPAAPSSAPPAAPSSAPPAAPSSAPPAASGDDPTAPLPTAGGAGDEPTTEVTRVDPGPDMDRDQDPDEGTDGDRDGVSRRG
ncbi:hypothetical protein [Actinoplanes auranticolor]|uniref:Uncharacterized protein n=1 Tax=Actinoplanes auranticolor TaxID=47988 RepID=A0A919S3P3_9ACTN|nr:hypothetical protein [Actinoplanes auranticolor]GIM63707.1 hypothetical protein Aau02nite_05810 [Actinoplanes auranticolor]